MQDTRALRQAIRFILLYLIQYVHGRIYSPQPFLYSILQLPEKNRSWMEERKNKEKGSAERSQTVRTDRTAY